MIVEDEEIDERRDDISGEGRKEERCPKYYETEGGTLWRLRLL